MGFILVLWPTDHFSIGMWPSDEYEFETPTLNSLSYKLYYFSGFNAHSVGTKDCDPGKNVILLIF